MKPYWGGIEGGGTKFNCIVGREPGDIIADIRIPTTSLSETMERVIEFFKEAAEKVELGGIGLGSFGPVDLDIDSASYGYTTNTTKLGWEDTDIVGLLHEELGVPIGFDTDVNVAALGEFRWGAAKGLSNFIYFTIGTGIGGGGMVNGELVHGMIHPEMGHMRIPHDLSRDPFPGNCSFHGDCFEGLASGLAIAERWGQSAETLPNDHPAWALETHYIALGVVNTIMILSPMRVVLGGGVMHHPGLIEMVRKEVLEILNDYVNSKAILERMDEYIVPPKLGDHAGRWGAVALAQKKMGYT